MTSPAITSLDAGTRLRGTVPLWIVPAVLCAGLFGYVLLFGGYLVTVLGLAAVYAVFCTGLNLFMGYTGQASFGQSAFAALGGYGTAVLCAGQGWEPLAGLLASMALSGAVALVVGYPTLRLRGHYLAMATFALGLIAYELSIEWTGITQGYMGYAGIPPLGVAGWELDGERGQLVALILFMLAGVWVAGRIRASRFGRALRAIAGSEQAAVALGIPVARYKLAAFVIAAMYASVAGSLLAHFVGFISPEIFGLPMVVLGFTMLYLGGIGTIWGPVLGAVVASLLPELFRGLKEVQDIAYSAVLILMLIFLPGGLAGLIARWSRPAR